MLQQNAIAMLQYRWLNSLVIFTSPVAWLKRDERTAGMACSSSEAEHVMDRLVRLQHTLETEIPITVAIGLRVAAYDNGMLLLAAPLAPNINHKDTVFAGSINAVVSLAGWSLLWCLLDEATLRGKIIIQDSTIQYLHPVAKDFVARCDLPAEAQVHRFLKVLRSKSRARLELHAEIREAQTLAVNFTGRYVVQLAPAE